MLSKEEEVKRSRLWRIVMSVSSVLIIVIAAFFLVKMFRSNPLEGTWKNEESDMVITIKGSNSLTVSIPEALEGEGIKISLDYSMDKDEKTISIKMNEAAKEKAIVGSDGRLTGKAIESAASSLLTTFDYSVDQKELTLTEREYRWYPVTGHRVNSKGIPLQEHISTRRGFSFSGWRVIAALLCGYFTGAHLTLNVPCLKINETKHWMVIER